MEIKYWIRPFLLEVHFEFVLGIAIGYTRVDKTLVLIIPFFAIEIQYVKIPYEPK